MRSVINDLSDSYCIIFVSLSNSTVFESEPSSEMNIFRKQIEKSKLFICFPSQNYLNSDRCMSQLKFATRILKKVFILHDTENYNMNNLAEVLNANCKMVSILAGDAKDRERLRLYIDNFLR